MKKLIIVMAILLTSCVEKRVEATDMIENQMSLFIRWDIIK